MKGKLAASESVGVDERELGNPSKLHHTQSSSHRRAKSVSKEQSETGKDQLKQQIGAEKSKRLKAKPELWQKVNFDK